MANRERQLVLGIFGGEPKQVMRELVLALLPALVASCYVFGWGVVLNLAIAVASAVLAEALMLRLRCIPWCVVADGSAALTAILLALALPPHVPWWLIVVASVCAIVIGKQLYGGLGNNLFNPAMVGYAIVIIAYPLYLTAWPDIQSLATRFDWSRAVDYAIRSGGENYVSGLTGATPLDAWRHDPTWQPHVSQDVLHWNLINAGFLIGGGWLLWRGIIQWYIPAAMLATLAVAAALFSGSLSFATSVYLHLGCGATMVGAFFIATDPVTAPRCVQMKLLFGIGVGALIFVIRQTGTYADGLAFAILLMNMFVPLMDRYER